METTIQDPNAPGALMLPPGEIERWVRDFHDERARSGGWPTIYVRKRDASNIALLLADEEETVITSLALWGEMIEITGKRNDNPHLGKWSEDSDVEKYEKAASR